MKIRVSLEAPITASIELSDLTFTINNPGNIYIIRARNQNMKLELYMTEAEALELISALEGHERRKRRRKGLLGIIRRMIGI